MTKSLAIDSSAAKLEIGEWLNEEVFDWEPPPNDILKAIPSQYEDAKPDALPVPEIRDFDGANYRPCCVRPRGREQRKKPSLLFKRCHASISARNHFTVWPVTRDTPS